MQSFYWNLLLLVHGTFSVITVGTSVEDRTTANFNGIVDSISSKCLVKIIYKALDSNNFGNSRGQIPVVLVKMNEDENIGKPRVELLSLSSRIGRLSCTFNLVYFHFNSFQGGTESTLWTWLHTTVHPDPGTFHIPQNIDRIYTILFVPLSKSAFSWASPYQPIYWFTDLTIQQFGILFPTEGHKYDKNYSLCLHVQGSYPVVGNFLCNEISTFSLETLDSFLIPPREWKVKMGEMPNEQFEDTVGTNALAFFTRWNLLKELTKATNSTICPIANPVCKYRMELPVIGIDLLISVKTWDQLAVVTHSANIKFLTCYYSKPGLRFQIYQKPFQPELWLAIGITGILLSTFLHFMNLKSEFGKSFSGVMFYISLLLDEGYAVTSKMWNSPIFRLSSAAWLLSSVLITNCYNGLLISELNAPLQGEKLNNFSQIFCHRQINGIYLQNEVDKDVQDGPWIFSKIMWWSLNKTDQSMSRHEHLKSYQSPNCFSLLSKPVRNVREEDNFIMNPNQYSLFSELHGEMLKFYILFRDMKMMDSFLNFVNPQHRHYPLDPSPLEFPVSSNIIREVAIEKEISKCGESAYIGPADDLALERMYLSNFYHKQKFYISEGSFLSRMVGWTFTNYGSSKMPIFLKRLVWAGIPKQFSEVQRARDYLRRREGTKAIGKMNIISPISIHGSVQTIFIIGSAFSTAAGLLLVAEVFYFYRESIFSLKCFIFIRTLALRSKLQLCALYYNIDYTFMHRVFSKYVTVSWFLLLCRRFQNRFSPQHNL
jgi:hypothetical protein